MTTTLPVKGSRSYCLMEGRAKQLLEWIDRAFKEAYTGRPKDACVAVARG
jgi:thiamine pyrophosphate-dependent acetolactate synthase large subunit-like protein